MIQTIEIRKSDVLTEVRRTTAYAGAKTPENVPLPAGAKNAYEVFKATEENDDLLERFYKEACDDVTALLGRFITSVDDTYKAECDMPSNYDTALTASLTGSLRNYMINEICARWLQVAEKAEWKNYADNATANMMDARGKLYNRKRPTRKQ